MIIWVEIFGGMIGVFGIIDLSMINIGFVDISLFFLLVFVIDMLVMNDVGFLLDLMFL